MSPILLFQNLEGTMLLLVNISQYILLSQYETKCALLDKIVNFGTQIKDLALQEFWLEASWHV